MKCFSKVKLHSVCKSNLIISISCTNCLLLCTLRVELLKLIKFVISASFVPPAPPHPQNPLKHVSVTTFGMASNTQVKCVWKNKCV